jgi:O-methyltransferase involved in polyketide biosynthesis
MARRPSSASAAGVSLLGAIEAKKPETARICNDLYAHVMIFGGLSFFFS